MSGRLTSRTAIVTGASSGIGRASAELFASEGAQVLAVDVVPPAVPFASPLVRPITCDITGSTAPSAIVEEVESAFGGLDILFNNAGISFGYIPIHELGDDDWQRMLDINLRAMFRLTRETVPLLRRSAAGRVIATASTSAVHAQPGLGAYSVSKVGVAVLMRGFAADLGPLGITCNAISPGPTRTPIVAQRLDDAAIAERWLAKTCLKRFGEPEDVARAALYLASDDARYVTGQVLTVDGGFAASI